MRHTATIYDRGGVHPIGVIEDVRRVKWERLRDDISEAEVLAFDSKNCGPLLGSLAPFRHELVIHRDGRRVWEGPVTHLDYKGSQVTITARDVLQWAGRTTIKRDIDNTYPNVTTVVRRAEAVLRREMQHHETPRYPNRVPPLNFFPNIRAIHRDNDAENASMTYAYEKTVWEELDDLAHRGGLDYTVAGRMTLLWDTHVNIGQGRMLTDADFNEDLAVTIYGMDLATTSVVTDRRGRHAGVGAEDDYYGSVEVLHGTYNEDDDPDDPDFVEVSIEEMREQARRNMSNRYPTPLVVRVPENASILPETFDELYEFMIPGVRFPVRTTKTLRHVEQMQKLDRVSVEEASSGERIAVTLTPFPRQVPKGVEGDANLIEEVLG